MSCFVRSCMWGDKIKRLKSKHNTLPKWNTSISQNSSPSRIAALSPALLFPFSRCELEAQRSKPTVIFRVNPEGGPQPTWTMQGTLPISTLPCDLCQSHPYRASCSSSRALVGISLQMSCLDFFAWLKLQTIETGKWSEEELEGRNREWWDWGWRTSRGCDLQCPGVFQMRCREGRCRGDLISDLEIPVRFHG